MKANFISDFVKIFAVSSTYGCKFCLVWNNICSPSPQIQSLNKLLANSIGFIISDKKTHAKLFFFKIVKFHLSFYFKFSQYSLLYLTHSSFEHGKILQFLVLSGLTPNNWLLQMIIDHRFTDSTDSCDASQARFHRLGICSICGISLTSKVIRICGVFFVMNFRMTRDLDLKKSCPLPEPDRYFSCS